jgi:hypothetical protein
MARRNDPRRLQRLRRWLLVTRDAASLYQRCGFADRSTASPISNGSIRTRAAKWLPHGASQR